MRRNIIRQWRGRQGIRCSLEKCLRVIRLLIYQVWKWIQYLLFWSTTRKLNKNRKNKINRIKQVLRSKIHLTGSNKFHLIHLSNNNKKKYQQIILLKSLTNFIKRDKHLKKLVKPVAFPRFFHNCLQNNFHLLELFQILRNTKFLKNMTLWSISICTHFSRNVVCKKLKEVWIIYETYPQVRKLKTVIWYPTNLKESKREFRILGIRRSINLVTEQTKNSTEVLRFYPVENLWSELEIKQSNIGISTNWVLRTYRTFLKFIIRIVTGESI